MRKKATVGVLLYTFNRTDDAAINIEIIRETWKAQPALSDVVIVHAYNGDNSWWPEPYLEDDLLRLPNPGHFEGAELLLNEGIRYFSEHYPSVKYVVILAADTWCTNSAYVAQIIETMQERELRLATCVWGSPEKDYIWKMGMALDFAVVDIAWATKYQLFPIRFLDFVKDFGDAIYYQGEEVYLERVFALRFRQAIFHSENVPSENMTRDVALAHLYRMVEREPVHDVKKWWGKTVKGRRMYWPKLGLITHHEPAPKRDILRVGKALAGKYAQRLMAASDMGYYNDGLTKNRYNKRGKKVDYGD